MPEPKISICIPAYKNTLFLKRLLDSVADQTFKDVEVIVTDDSPDDSVEKFVKGYDRIALLEYYRNPVALGTPENWNEGIRRATGAWIKLMHDDDWFTHADVLKEFYDATLRHPECSFIFSAFQNIDDEKGMRKVVRCDWTDRFVLWLSPLHLFKKVYVGNPSCTLVKRDIGLFYDSEFKWVVDFEYYIRVLWKVKQYCYIDKVLLNIGFHSEQVTVDCFRIPEVELPECHRMIEKLGFGILRNIIVYDYYWRLYRNLDIRSESQMALYYNKPLHPVLRDMIRAQRKVSPALLKRGFISKLLMSVNYFFSLFRRI